MILALNSGSSSLKYGLFEPARAGSAEPARCLARGNLPAVAAGGSALAVRALFARLGAEGLPAPRAVGHRLVHGGPHHHRPARVTPDLLAGLRAAIPFAPLHLPRALDLVVGVAAEHPRLPQVACFDTAFHHALPEVSRSFPLPARFSEQGLRRYGFHGLSFEFIVATLGGADVRPALGRAVIAHLGSGASMAAVVGGQSIDTTMGLTPSGGLMMATRTGDLDPGLFLYLLNAGWTPAALERLVNHEGGLLGVSGTTSDVPRLLEARGSDPRAALALQMFCYRCRKAIGALAAALGGLDSLVFTGGIGENAGPIREDICAELAFLGVAVDAGRNQGAPFQGGVGTVISPDGAAVTVRVVSTDEERVIATHVADVLGA